MVRVIFLAGIILFIFALSAIAKFSPDQAWQFEQLRTWAPEPDEAIWVGDTSIGAAGHPEIPSDDPLYKKLSNKFSKATGIVPLDKPPLVPIGKLVWWDVDNDGTKDIVFAGGASMSPYFVILKEVGDKWDVWQDCRGKLLTIFIKDNQVIMIASIDGYGVERDRELKIYRCNLFETGSCMEVTFRWTGDLGGPTRQGTVNTCTTVRDTGLRISPEVDNTPYESGMGFDWPGNLYQELAEGSSGWILNKTRDQKGEQWSLVVFPDPMTEIDNDEPLKAIITPMKVCRTSPTGDSSKTKFIVGWVKTSDLNGF